MNCKNSLLSSPVPELYQGQRTFGKFSSSENVRLQLKASWAVFVLKSRSRHSKSSCRFSTQVQRMQGFCIDEKIRTQKCLQNPNCMWGKKRLTPIHYKLCLWPCCHLWRGFCYAVKQEQYTALNTAWSTQALCLFPATYS